MSVSVVAPIAQTSEAISKAQLEELERTAPERRRRHLVHLIDAALEQAEQAMLAEVAEPPALAELVIEWFEGQRPRTAEQAHDELFRIQERLMKPDPADVDDEEPRVCACGCGRPVEASTGGRPREYATKDCWASAFRPFERPAERRGASNG
jgi:hypothetical protein